MQDSAVLCSADNVVQFSAVQCSAVTEEFLPSIFSVLKQIIKLQYIYFYSLNDLRIIQWTRSNDQPEGGRTETVKLLNIQL